MRFDFKKKENLSEARLNSVHSIVVILWCDALEELRQNVLFLCSLIKIRLCNIYDEKIQDSPQHLTLNLKITIPECGRRVVFINFSSICAHLHQLNI